MTINANFKKGTGTVEKSALQINAYGEINGDLPVASADTLGGVKVGEGLSITEAGVLSASDGGMKPFKITVTTPSLNVYAADKTLDEIVEAYNNGMYIYIVYANEIFNFNFIEYDEMEQTRVASMLFVNVSFDASFPSVAYLRGFKVTSSGVTFASKSISISS